MRHAKLSLLLFAALLAAAYAAHRRVHLFRAQAADNPNKPPGPPESHRLVGPLFIQNDQFSSFITLVDNTMADLYADVVVNAADGEQATKTRVYLAGHGIKVIQLADILGAAASRVSYGSITIVPQESLALMPILAQVSMVGNADSDRPEYLESEPMMPEMAMTNLLEGVAIEPARVPVVALTNTSAAPRTVSVSCLSNSGRAFPEQSVRIQGSATRMIRVCENQDADSGETASHSGKANALGILVSYDGKPGGVQAFGYSAFGESGQLISIPFSDGGTSESPKIAWPGVPVGFSRGLTWGEFEPEGGNPTGS